MKAIKINVYERTLTYIDISNYREICSTLNDKCNNFICPMIFETLDTMYADYYAGINNKNKSGFLLDAWTHPIIGNALIVGTDLNGDLCDVIISISDIENNISFVSNDLVQNWVYNNFTLENIAFSKN